MAGSRPQRRRGPGRPRILYHAAAGAEPRARDEYRLLATVLAGAVEPDRCAAVGRRWGHALARGRDADDPVGAVVDLLAEQGFEPLAAGRHVEMHRCPFHDLAETVPEVVCAVHRGIVDGMLEELGSPLAVAELEVFPRPDLCVARLAAARL